MDWGDLSHGDSTSAWRLGWRGVGRGSSVAPPPRPRPADRGEQGETTDTPESERELREFDFERLGLGERSHQTSQYAK